MITFDNKICHLTFSHTDCSDIWPAYFGETSKYLKTNMKHFLCVNRVDDKIPSNVTPIVYDESKPYPQRLLYCLDQLQDYDFIFFDHEDMFLYDKPKEHLIEEYYSLLKSGEFDHIRMGKGGSHWSWKVKKQPSLHKILPFSSWIFSIQPSFWKRYALMAILKENLNCNIWELEVLSQKAIKKLKLKVAYSYDQGPKRGLHHYDNSVYPYIATAIGKGKWNYSEYKSELNKVFKEYNIDPKKRGCS